MAPSPKSFLIFDAVLIIDMMQNLALKAISALNWLTCRTPKRPRDRMALDRDSPCYYPPTDEEEPEVGQPVEFLNSQGPNSATITELPGWRIITWRDGTVQIQKEAQHTQCAACSRTYPICPSDTRREGNGTTLDDLHSVTEQLPQRREICQEAQVVSDRKLPNTPHPLPGEPASPVNIGRSTPRLVSAQGIETVAETRVPLSHPRALESHRPNITTLSLETIASDSAPAPRATGRPTTSATPNPSSTINTLNTNPRARPALLPTRPPLSTTPLTPETLHRLLDTFDRALAHTRYAICGHAALMVWGYRSTTTTPAAATAEGEAVRPPLSHVSVVCPAEDRDVILTWARAVGWVVYGSSVSSSPTPFAFASASAEGGRGVERGGDVIGVPLLGGSGSGSGEVWGFRLRAVRDREVWGRLQRVRPVELDGSEAGLVVRTRAQVMAVPTLLDEFARAWYFCAVRGQEVGTGREGYIAELVVWLLWLVAEDYHENGNGGRWKLTLQNMSCLVYGGFWSAFVGRYPEALGLLERCGLPGPAHVVTA